MLNIILQIISIFFGIYGAYYVVTGICAFLKPQKDEIKEEKLHKFSIIIAARNEEAVIGNLIDSLKKQNYDQDKYVINVIVNNSTDNTLKVAKKHGANAFKCEIPVKSKGEVLHYIFNKYKDLDHDAYIIFDADNGEEMLEYSALKSWIKTWTLSWSIFSSILSEEDRVSKGDEEIWISFIVSFSWIFLYHK